MTFALSRSAQRCRVRPAHNLCPQARSWLPRKCESLSVVTVNGQQSALIENTPTVWKELLKVRGSYVGLGMMLDIAHTFTQTTVGSTSLMPNAVDSIAILWCRKPCCGWSGEIRSGTWHSESDLVGTHSFYTLFRTTLLLGGWLLIRRVICLSPLAARALTVNCM